jgi:uncharacterized membrane protein
MPVRRKAVPEELIGMERILFFSDAVMAIAITLLALDIRVPQVDPAIAVTELPRQLSSMGPNLMTFFISFIVIGIYWISHHRYFGYIKRYDNRLILLNLMFLFFIICMPFLASMLGRYVFVPVALVAYTLAISALGFSMWLIWWYASHDHRLIAADLDPETIRMNNIRLLIAPLIFLVAVPFAYVSSISVILVWWISPFVVMIATRFTGRKSIKR